MSNEQIFNLSIYGYSTVILKEGSKHPAYYGTVYTTRGRGDYSDKCEYWFVYQNTPRQCKPGQCGFDEV